MMRERRFEMRRHTCVESKRWRRKKTYVGADKERQINRERRHILICIIIRGYAMSFIVDNRRSSVFRVLGDDVSVDSLEVATKELCMESFNTIFPWNESSSVRMLNLVHHPWSLDGSTGPGVA
ncbi:hypothetical protein L2E82_44628 [Cichorium intybus]|uniref:Uncharacterized protein n=1 Tax=Cichorium intybus TaxID=13427 RepID=A0ACB8ZV63_CICIN|nr:hypothetical protein L2E82_44628 [Cichorium intybus]